MSILSRFGLAPRPPRARRTGIQLQGRKSDPATPELTRRVFGERLVLILILAGIGLLAFPNVSVYDGSAEVGDVWRSEDVIAPFDFSIRLPDDVIARRRDSVASAEPPIFRENPEALGATLARLDSLDARLDSAFASFAAWQIAREAGQGEAARADSVRYIQRRDAMRSSLSADQWRVLLRSDADRRISGARGLALDDQLLAEASRVSRELLGRGVLSVNKDSVTTPSLVVRNPDPRVRSEIEIGRDEVLGAGEALVVAQRAFGTSFPMRPDTVRIGMTFLRTALEPNYLYQARATAERRALRIESVMPTQGRVKRGFTVIRGGDEVTQERYEQLQSLAFAQRQRSGDVSWARTVLGRFLLVAFALSQFFLYLYLLRPVIFYDLRRMLLVSLLLAFVLLGFLVAGMWGGGAAYVVPVSLVSILLTIAFDSRVGILAAMTLALVGGLTMGYDFEFAFATLLVGILAVFSVRDVKNRSQLLASAALVLLGYALILLGYALLRADPFTDRFLAELLAVSIHALLVLLAAPILYGIERGFGITTDMTLLELSDTNRPLLKELSLKAPGTFNHSLQVANLAEAAADAIGANALRARVGALYHDVGKMRKPEYFIENQQPGENPHEKINPSMSAIVLMSHVKDGLEIAKDSGLPVVLRDFIASHHGTSLMEYFYRRAQEEASEEDTIDKSEFRYPGPRPQTNEQAIVMLADSIEAASRSLDKPTPKKLESLIDGIVASRLADGQLDGSELTFSDLATIKDTFLTLLAGIYHFRVRYPDQEPETEADDVKPEGAVQETPDGEPDGGREVEEDAAPLHRPFS